MEARLLGNGSIEARSDYKDDPTGQYQYWCVELAAAEKNLKPFIRQGNRIIERFLAKPPVSDETRSSAEGNVFRLNLFYANTTTLISTLYGDVPKVDVSRRYADSSDDVGRVAAELMERMLNNDLSENGQEVDSVLRTNLEDRLTVGLGLARVRYVAEFDANNMLLDEDAPIDYVHWRDVRWGWARNFAEIPWIAFRAYMKKEEVAERFGEACAKLLQYKVQQTMSEDENGGHSDDDSDAWMKCEVWEIWDKTKRQVVWVSPGYDKTLDTKDDPLQLSNFWPCPPFFIANCTSTLYIPTADYHLAQDLYNEIDKLQTRISIITDAVKVVGVYDSSSGEIARMLKEGVDNDLIPVQNWAMFAEKGGITGQVDWFPIEDVVNALVQLIQMRDQTISLLQQITGMSDLMRGELKNQYEGVGQTQMKAQFGSMRIQALQDQFARYATDLMQIKAEVIARHFDPATIIVRSNAEQIPQADHGLIAPAIKLIKDPKRARLQTKIETENLAMTDYAKLREERTGYITALATFMQSAAPLVEMEPTATPYLLQLLQWGLAGFKGSSEIEGVLDKAVEAANQAAEQAKQQQGEPTPEEKIAQMENQAAIQLEQMKQQGEIAKIQAKAQADAQTRNADMQADLQTNEQEHLLEMARLNAELQATLAEIKAKLFADVQKETAQAEANILQTQAAAQAEIGKDTVTGQIELQKEAVKTGLKIDEIEANAEAKIKEAKAKPEPDNDD